MGICEIGAWTIVWYISAWIHFRGTHKVKKAFGFCHVVTLFSIIRLICRLSKSRISVTLMVVQCGVLLAVLVPRRLLSVVRMVPFVCTAMTAADHLWSTTRHCRPQAAASHPLHTTRLSLSCSLGAATARCAAWTSQVGGLTSE